MEKKEVLYRLAGAISNSGITWSTPHVPEVLRVLAIAHEEGQKVDHSQPGWLMRHYENVHKELGLEIDPEDRKHMEIDAKRIEGNVNEDEAVEGVH